MSVPQGQKQSLSKISKFLKKVLYFIFSKLKAMMVTKSIERRSIDRLLPNNLYRNTQHIDIAKNF